MLGAKAQMMPEMTHSKLPTMRGNLRPIVSLIGPPNNWPNATPKVIIPMVICILDAVVFNSPGIIGNAGK